jgi:uncharacterized membrane protein YjgN (DUF898 family)
MQPATPPGLPPAAAVPPPARPEFLGSGAEYFRIWIVNLMLSLVTLGVYSPWAKVRRERYFHRATRLAGVTFDWDAEPLVILRGRALGVALLIAFQAAAAWSPLAAGVGSAIFAAAMPWLITAALRFRLHHTIHRGLRFGFRGSVGEGARAYLIWPLLSVLSLGALTAHTIRRQQEFTYGHAAYGDTAFACRLPLWPVYRALLLAGSVVVAGLVALVKLGGSVVGPEGVRSATLAGMAGSALAVAWLAGAIYRVEMSNLTWNHLSLGAHRFRSDQTIPSYLRLQLGNLLGTLLTLGLFRPWAAVRSARYRAARLTFVPGSPLDEHVAGPAASPRAVGDEVADLFGLDVGF